MLDALDRLPLGGMVTDGRTGLLITIPARADRKTAETPGDDHRTPETPESR
jgi:hypothetical protein